MKIWVILGLVAGPFVVRGQMTGGPALPAAGAFSPTLEAPNFARLRFAASYNWDRAFPDNLHWWRNDGGAMTLYRRDSLRVLLPDRMSCLVPLGITDRMNKKMTFCCGVERMPNALKQAP